MKDNLGRTIDYMRISITDRCNLRCAYCMPEDLPVTDMAAILTFEEIVRVVEAGVSLGIVNYRITGGEPLARRGAVDLVRMVKAVPGVRAVKMTTNAVQLAETAEELAAAGLDGLNISLDTLDAERFRALTGRDSFDRVMEGIDAAARAGLPSKFNAVNLADTDPAAMVRFAEEKGAPQRFIEMMPIGRGGAFAGRSNAELLAILESEFGAAERLPSKFGNGPAAYYAFPQLAHSVGFISALSHKFCAGCNRVRLTAEGYLKLCLCYEDGLDLRALLRAGADGGELAAAIGGAVLGKPAEHCFEHKEEITEQHGMSAIGG